MNEKQGQGPEQGFGEELETALEAEEAALEEELEAVREGEQEVRVRGNKMGTMPIGKLLVSVSLPIIISMLVQALYNVVDSIFVARLGEDALAAVGLVFPVQNLMIAVAVGTGVGMSSLLGRRLGERNMDAANRVAENGVFLGVLSWLAFAVLGLFGSEFFMGLFVSGDMNPDIISMGAGYMRIVTVASLGVFMSIKGERLLQATGRSMLSMAAQLTGAIINIILDPIMIFGYFGLPAMGVEGAALATVIGQFGSMFVAFGLNHKRNPEIRLRLKGFRPSGAAIKGIYKVGLPSIIMQSIGSVMVSGMNLILGGFGTTPVSAFSIYFKLQSFIFMPVFGLNSGMVPIIAFNYGAQNRRRIEKTVRRGVVVAVCIMLVGVALFWLLPELLLSFFEAGDSMVTVGIPMLRTISLHFPIAAVAIVLSGSFQALGKGMYSLLMSAIRQLLILMPAAWLLSRIGGLDALWFSFLLAEVVCVILALILFRRAHRKIIAPLPEGAPG